MLVLDFTAVQAEISDGVARLVILVPLYKLIGTCNELIREDVADLALLDRENRCRTLHCCAVITRRNWQMSEVTWATYTI